MPSFKGTRGLKQHKQRTECGRAVGASVDSNQKRCLPSGCEPELLTGQDTNHCSSSRYAIDIEIRKLKKIECKQPIQWPQMSAQHEWIRFDKSVRDQLPDHLEFERRMAQLELIVYEEATRSFGVVEGMKTAPFHGNRRR